MKTREELLTQFKHDLPDYVDPLSGSSPYEPADDVVTSLGSANLEVATAASIANERRLHYLARLGRYRSRWSGDAIRYRTSREVEVLR